MSKKNYLYFLSTLSLLLFSKLYAQQNPVTPAAADRASSIAKESRQDRANRPVVTDSICRGYQMPQAYLAYMKKNPGCKISGPYQGEIQTTPVSKKGNKNLEKAFSNCIKQDCAGISADWYIDGTWRIHKTLSRSGFRPDENSYSCTFLLEGC